MVWLPPSSLPTAHQAYQMLTSVCARLQRLQLRRPRRHGGPLPPPQGIPCLPPQYGSAYLNIHESYQRFCLNLSLFGMHRWCADVLLRVLLVVQRLLQENKHCSKRDIYYMYPSIFVGQCLSAVAMSGQLMPSVSCRCPVLLCCVSDNQKSHCRTSGC
jgi:hypothetical protein